MEIGDFSSPSKAREDSGSLTAILARESGRRLYFFLLLQHRPARAGFFSTIGHLLHHHHPPSSITFSSHLSSLTSLPSPLSSPLYFDFARLEAPTVRRRFLRQFCRQFFRRFYGFETAGPGSTYRGTGTDPLSKAAVPVHRPLI
ncbi:hypothetical protein Dimus_024145 [Dionaea muscipula]